MAIILWRMADLFGSNMGHRSPVRPIDSVSYSNEAGPMQTGKPSLTPDAMGKPSMPTKLLLLFVLMILGARPAGERID